MKHYEVLSPEMSEIISIPGMVGGPLEYFRCGCTVEANNKREAKIKAVKHPDMQGWVIEQRSDGCNPFTGLEIIDPVCEHGKCHCELCRDYCDICYTEEE